MSENAAAGTNEVIPERKMPAHFFVEKRELRAWAVDEDEGTRARELEGGKGVLPGSSFPRGDRFTQASSRFKPVTKAP